MLLQSILKAVSLLLAISFVFLQAKGLEMEAAGVSALMLVLLSVLYGFYTNDKRRYFFMFLVLFTVAHTISFVAWFIPVSPENSSDYFYYLVNILYIVSYVSLIVNVVKDLNFRFLLSKFLLPIIVLIILDVFCVIVVSSTTEGVLSTYENILEYLYNSVIMVLLSSALINYMYRNDNKSMMFLMASICILFSEIIQFAYLYVLYENNLSVIYSSFLVIALFLYYLQSKLKFTGPVEVNFDERLEA